MGYATRQSSAYDYKRAPAQAPRQHEQPRLEALPENRNIRRTAPAKVPYVKYALIALCIFVVLGAVLGSYVQLTELTAQNAKMRNSLSELQSGEKALQAKKEQQFNLALVEQRAKEMGMVKLDKSLSMSSFPIPSARRLRRRRRERPALSRDSSRALTRCWNISNDQGNIMKSMGREDGSLRSLFQHRAV